MKTAHYSFEQVESPPEQDKLQEGVVYVCRSEGRADLLCPCGCNDVISITLVPSDTPPRWKIEGNTIAPSINRMVGCRSHFSITNGIVIV